MERRGDAWAVQTNVSAQMGLGRLNMRRVRYEFDSHKGYLKLVGYLTLETGINRLSALYSKRTF